MKEFFERKESQIFTFLYFKSFFLTKFLPKYLDRKKGNEEEIVAPKIVYVVPIYSPQIAPLDIERIEAGKNIIEVNAYKKI